MKKIASKKLTFQTQTVRVLAHQDLTDVAGGRTTLTGTLTQSGRPACRTTITVSRDCTIG